MIDAGLGLNLSASLTTQPTVFYFQGHISLRERPISAHLLLTLCYALCSCFVLLSFQLTAISLAIHSLLDRKSSLDRSTFVLPMEMPGISSASMPFPIGLYILPNPTGDIPIDGGAGEGTEAKEGF